jgi:hypothetical protein
MTRDRRRFLELAGATLLLPLASVTRAATPAFAPPAGPMRYTRALRREMIDGAAIVATRYFAVRFVPLAGGFRLEGAENAAPDVSGPPSLEAILQLERERRDSSFFPLRIDRTGRIAGEPGKAGSPQLDRAVEEALHRVAASGRPADDAAAMRSFVLGLQQAAASLVAAPPADLFHPLSAPFSESREIAMPDGGTGTVSVAFTASLDPATGLMREAERLVVTRLAQSERRTAERWTLAPI